MKKNGFTMVELIITIVLLALIAVVIGTNMVGLQSKQTEKNYKAFTGRLESAACQYIEKKENATQKRNCKSNPNSSYCNITVGTLINAGLIDYDEIDPSTDEVVNTNLVVKIKWSNGEQSCEFAG